VQYALYWGITHTHAMLDKYIEPRLTWKSLRLFKQKKNVGGKRTWISNVNE